MPPVALTTRADHPDRLRWNARYAQRAPGATGFGVAPWLGEVLRVAPADGEVLDLAAGRSGTALALAELGRHVTAVDVSDVALCELGDEAVRRGLTGRISAVHADLAQWAPAAPSFAIVLSRLFWDPVVFGRAREWVAPGGVIAWEALAAGADDRSNRWRVEGDTLLAALGAGFTVLHLAEPRIAERASWLVIARRDDPASDGTPRSPH